MKLTESAMVALARRFRSYTSAILRANTAVAQIQRDQVTDYAFRKGMSVE